METYPLILSVWIQSTVHSFNNITPKKRNLKKNKHNNKGFQKLWELKRFEHKNKWFQNIYMLGLQPVC